jgi:hypothetical protein
MWYHKTQTKTNVTTVLDPHWQGRIELQVETAPLRTAMCVCLSDRHHAMERADELRMELSPVLRRKFWTCRETRWSARLSETLPL